LKFAQDGTRLVSAGADRKLVIYDPGKRSVVGHLLGHGTEIWALDISADGDTAVSGAGYGGNVLTWSLAENWGPGSQLAQIKACTVLADGRIIINRESALDLEYYDPVRESFEPAQARPFVLGVEGKPHRALSGSGGPLAGCRFPEHQVGSFSKR
jgi:WD40 repeat protein